MQSERTGASVTWQTNRYRSCWRKSMLTWPKRFVRVDACTARANCTAPSIGASPAASPNRTGSETRRFIALVFVAIRTAAANGTPRLRSGSWGARFTGALWWCWWRRCSMGSRRHGCTLCARAWAWLGARWNIGGSGGCTPLSRAPSGA